MRLHPGNGIWEIFVPGRLSWETSTNSSSLIKTTESLPLKSDPLAQFFEPPPGNASIVYASQQLLLDRR